MDLWDKIVVYLFGVLPAGKDGLKDWFTSHHMEHIWILLRDDLLHPNPWIFGLIPCLALEHFLPAVMENESRKASRWMDFVYPIFGTIIMVPFFAVLVTGVDSFFRAEMPFLNTGVLDGKPMWMQVTGAFLITDFMFYVSHFLRHKVRWFWFFHTIHHSQENLNPLTTHRGHAGEGVINTAIRTIPIAFIGGSPASWTVYVLLNGFWGYFIHANVRTNLGPLKYVLVTPQFHRIHHSMLPPHHDKNYGERLILWDWMFGTLYPKFDEYPPTGVLGIERWAVETKPTPVGLFTAFLRQMAYPFFKIGQSVSGAFGGPPSERRANVAAAPPREVAPTAGAVTERA